MSQRFFLDERPTQPGIELGGDQAHHLANVMRAKPGEQVVLFDGTGFEYLAEIQRVSKKSIQLEILQQIESSRELRTSLIMAVALPKGDRQKFLIEKLVELGVTRLIPLATQRSVAVANDKVIRRLKKQVIEACKQCERNSLMEIESTMSVSELIHLDPGPSTERYFAHPYLENPISKLEISSDQILVAIGPEGGLDDDEVTRFEADGWTPLKLGPTILRVETAAVAAAAILGIGRE